MTNDPIRQAAQRERQRRGGVKILVQYPDDAGRYDEESAGACPAQNPANVVLRIVYASEPIAG